MPTVFAAGVYTLDNKIERYLRVARAILNVENAFFTFHDEPYIWVATEESDFKAASIHNNVNLSAYFENNLIVTRTHKNYEKFAQHIAEIGLSSQRVLCYDFKLGGNMMIYCPCLFL